MLKRTIIVLVNGATLCTMACSQGSRCSTNSGAPNSMRRANWQTQWNLAGEQAFAGRVVYHSPLSI